MYIVLSRLAGCRQARAYHCRFSKDRPASEVQVKILVRDATLSLAIAIGGLGVCLLAKDEGKKYHRIDVNLKRG